jgi:hypothetical protein
MPLCPYHMDRFVDLPSGDYLISPTVRLTRSQPMVLIALPISHITA